MSITVMASKIFDDLPPPPVARLLGWKLIAVDPQAGTIDLEFLAKTEFTNHDGFVQGGLIAAMLDDTLGPAAYAMANGERRAEERRVGKEDVRKGTKRW